MNRRFVVGASNLTAEQEKNLAKYISDNGGDWWHWIPNLWLLSFQKNEKIEVANICDYIISINPTSYVFSAEVKDIDWMAINIPAPKDRNGGTDKGWLLDFWGGEGAEKRKD